MIEAAASDLLHVTAERGRHDFEALEETLRDLVSSSFPSGFSLAVLDSDGPLFGAYGGLACRVGTVSPITASTLYDLASLTKVVCSVSLRPYSPDEDRSPWETRSHDGSHSSPTRTRPFSTS